jgi:hypothetical protein
MRFDENDYHGEQTGVRTRTADPLPTSLPTGHHRNPNATAQRTQRALHFVAAGKPG